MDKRDDMFQHLVLKGIWLAVRLLVDIRQRQGGAGSGFVMYEASYRGDLIDFGDLYGNQHETAKELRREKGYPDLPRSL